MHTIYSSGGATAMHTIYSSGGATAMHTTYSSGGATAIKEENVVVVETPDNATFIDFLKQKHIYIYTLHHMSCNYTCRLHVCVYTHIYMHVYIYIYITYYAIFCTG